MYKLIKSEREISEEKKKDSQIKHRKGDKMKYNELTYTYKKIIIKEGR